MRIAENRDVFVGIDVAFAKKKRLPVSVCHVVGGCLKPLPLGTEFDKPPAGFGNKAALDPACRDGFALSVVAWLKKLEAVKALRIVRIAIDAPSDYCGEQRQRRLCERALDGAGISCFATPSKRQFDDKVAAASAHLAAGGAESRMPNANQIWMLVGFSLFDRLKLDGRTCIETYPQAIVRQMECVALHKSTEAGFKGQLEQAAEVTGHQSADCLGSALATMGFGSRHDKLDAFLSSWIASLPAEHEKVFGSMPDDAIVVPNMKAIRESLLASGASI